MNGNVHDMPAHLGLDFYRLRVKEVP
jgi:hypothetical protein